MLGWFDIIRFLYIIVYVEILEKWLLVKSLMICGVGMRYYV